MKKMLAWLLLFAASALLLSGYRVNWLVYGVSICALLVFILLAEYESRSGDSRMVALTGVLVAVTVASRQLLHGIDFSPVFFIVIVAGRVFGFTVGFTVGALAMFVSNFFISQGPWTPFQMLGVGLTGAAATLLPKTKKYEIHLLTAYGIASAYLYGAFMDGFYWLAFMPTHDLETLQAVIAAGLFAATTRAIGNTFFLTIMGAVFLKILRRFQKRLKYKRTTNNTTKTRQAV
jgi:energy-coupling factor transport system substrate-specific component